MDIKEYRSLLGQLPIRSPTPRDLARMCPHLTPEQAVEAFRLPNACVAAPGMFARGSYYVLQLQEPWVEEVKVRQDNGLLVGGVKKHPALLNLASTECEPETPYAEEALQFMEENWGDLLIGSS